MCSRHFIVAGTLACVLCGGSSVAQADGGCGTVLTPETAAIMIEQQAAGLYDHPGGVAGGGPVVIPLALHVVRRDDGTGGVPLSQVTQAVAEANAAFAETGIEFCWTGAVDYVDNSAFYFIDNAAEFNAIRGVNVEPWAINIYYVGSLSIEMVTYCGYSSFLSDPPGAAQGIAMANYCYGGLHNDWLPHELGHYLNLLHTHETSMGTECVARTNCTIAGDQLCDTPADPLLGDHNAGAPGCQYTGSDTPPCASDPPYQPDPTNLMSYAPRACATTFTAGQVSRMLTALYDLKPELIAASCPPPCPGDANCDDTIDFFDIDPFLQALFDPAGYAAAYPACGPRTTDVNADDAVDFFDIDPFLACLFGNGCPACRRTPTIDMVNVPGGTFQMGDPFSEGAVDERPRHPVTLNAYAIDRYEVTNAQYAAALNWAKDQGNLITVPPINGVVYKFNSGTSTPYCDMNTASPSYSRITWSGFVFSVVPGKEDHPVGALSWFGAAAYCNWRSAMESRPLCYNVSTWECDFLLAGYRLPTEAEWEKAAGWDPVLQRHFRFGEHTDGGGMNSLSGQRANYSGSGDPFAPFTTPVGYYDGTTHGTYVTQDANSYYGCYDMSGNVWEWCHDWYSSYSAGPETDPTGPSTGTQRVLRGGSCESVPATCRSANREDNLPSNRNAHFMGVRRVIRVP